MFTGLIAELGTVERLAEGSISCQLTICAHKILDGLKIGDSVAVNGICLTVVRLGGNGFTVDVMPETLRRTTLCQVQSGDKVNLEKALRPVDGLDGHIVQGHVEGVGTISRIAKEGNAQVYRVESPPELLRFIVEKGSVAIDGISLTVTETDDSGFSVSLIPHTVKMTTLGFKHAGDRVNLETDILARYIEKMLGLKAAGKALPDNLSTGIADGKSYPEPELTEDFLRTHGF